MKVNDVDWMNWMPTEDAVITYILKGDEVLLIHKKKGLGAGRNHNYRYFPSSDDLVPPFGGRAYRGVDTSY